MIKYIWKKYFLRANALGLSLWIDWGDGRAIFGREGVTITVLGWLERRTAEAHASVLPQHLPSIKAVWYSWKYLGCSAWKWGAARVWRAIRKMGARCHLLSEERVCLCKCRTCLYNVIALTKVMALYMNWILLFVFKRQQNIDILLALPKVRGPQPPYLVVCIFSDATAMLIILPE